MAPNEMTSKYIDVEPCPTDTKHDHTHADIGIHTRVPMEPTPTDVLPYEDIIRKWKDTTGNYVIELRDEKLEEYKRDIKFHLESRDQRLQRYVREFALPQSKLAPMLMAFQDELLRGLRANLEHPDVWKPDECSFKMLDSCVPRLPHGGENGVFYALDFGGTNFRVVRTWINGTGTMFTSQKKFSLISATHYPKGLLDRRATATELFDFIVSALKSMMVTYGDIIPSSGTARALQGHGGDALGNCNSVVESSSLTCGSPEPHLAHGSGTRIRSSSWFGSTDNGGTGLATGACYTDEDEDRGGNPQTTTMTPVGFTFSFPCFQKSLTSAILVEWTKEFETGRGTDDSVEGRDVGKLLKDALHRQKVPAQLVAVINDTVGTLVSGAFDKKATTHRIHKRDTGKELCDFPVGVGLIVGTGINACYVDPEADQYRYTGSIINIECGNFDRELPLTSIDYEMDFIDRTNRSKQLLEKMISGAYMGEIARRTIVRILQHDAPKPMWEQYSLSAAKTCAIAQDESLDFSVTAKIVREIWNIEMCEKPSPSSSISGTASPNDSHAPLSKQCMLEIVKRVCWIVLDRAAGLAAVIVAAVAKRTMRGNSDKEAGVTVAIDGSLYNCVPLFRTRLRFYLDLMLPPEQSQLIRLAASDDGSGKGAALVAALVNNVA